MFDWVLNTPLSSFYKITLKVSESKEKGSNDNMDEGTSNVIQIRKMFTNGDQLQEFRCKEILQVLVKTFNALLKMKQEQLFAGFLRKKSWA